MPVLFVNGMTLSSASSVRFILETREGKSSELAILQEVRPAKNGKRADLVFAECLRGFRFTELEEFEGMNVLHLRFAKAIQDEDAAVMACMMVFDISKITIYRLGLYSAFKLKAKHEEISEIESIFQGALDKVVKRGPWSCPTLGVWGWIGSHPRVSIAKIRLGADEDMMICTAASLDLLPEGEIAKQHSPAEFSLIDQVEWFQGLMRQEFLPWDSSALLMARRCSSS